METFTSWRQQGERGRRRNGDGGRARGCAATQGHDRGGGSDGTADVSVDERAGSGRGDAGGGADATEGHRDAEGVIVARDIADAVVVVGPAMRRTGKGGWRVERVDG